MPINTEKDVRTRFSFLRTKRAIAVLSLLVCVAIILIVLAATHTIGDHASSGESTQKGSTTGASNETDTGLTSQISASTPTSTHGPSSATKSTSTLKASSSATATASPGSITDGTPLRVMCIGASIVLGDTSPGIVGFREVLRNNLVGLGVPVNMVGAVQEGNMTDNDVEAYPGNRVSQVVVHAKGVVPQMQPNVFAIHVGADNVLQNIDVDVAGAQMQDFINYLLDTSPRALVVLSTLLTNTVPNMEPLILNINAQYRNLMPVFANESKPVVLAEMHPGEGHDDVVPQIADIGPDGTHPLVSGYEKMGDVFTQAIQAADGKGFIQVPIDNGIPDDGAGSSSKPRRR